MIKRLIYINRPSTQASAYLFVSRRSQLWLLNPWQYMSRIISFRRGRRGINFFVLNTKGAVGWVVDVCKSISTNTRTYRRVGLNNIWAGAVSEAWHTFDAKGCFRRAQRYTNIYIYIYVSIGKAIYYPYMSPHISDVSLECHTFSWVVWHVPIYVTPARVLMYFFT